MLSQPFISIKKQHIYFSPTKRIFRTNDNRHKTNASATMTWSHCDREGEDGVAQLHHRRFMCFANFEI